MAMKVILSVPPIPVTTTDVEFEIWQGTKKLGRVKISKGGIDWYKPGAQRLTRRLTWAEFATTMELG
jgi:hypothetical protein